MGRCHCAACLHSLACGGRSAAKNGLGQTESSAAACQGLALTSEAAEFADLPALQSLPQSDVLSSGAVELAVFSKLRNSVVAQRPAAQTPVSTQSDLPAFAGLWMTPQSWPPFGKVSANLILACPARLRAAVKRRSLSRRQTMGAFPTGSQPGEVANLMS